LWPLIILGAVMLQVTGVHAYCQMRGTSSNAGLGCDGDGVPLAWKRPCLTYAVYADGSKTLSISQVHDIIGRSFRAWTQVRCNGQSIGFNVRPSSEPSKCDEPQYNQGNSNMNTFIFVRSGWVDRHPDECEINPANCEENAPEALAVTKVWYGRNSGEIFDVDVEINEDTVGPYGICPNPPSGNPCNVIDLQNVLTHEVGHLYGLAHPPSGQDAKETTMYPSSDADRGEIKKRDLDRDDIAGLCAIYSQTNQLSDACDYTPKGGATLVCGSDDEGCRVATSHGRRNNTPGALTATTALLVLAFILVKRRK